MVFLLTGVAGEVLFSDADLPVSFTSTMLALNVVGTASIAFTLLASFAHQRNAALTALRAEQEKSEVLLLNILPRPIADRLKAAAQPIADHFAAASIVFADVVDFTPLAQRLSPAEMVGMLDQLFSRFDALVERHGLEKIKTIGDCYMAAAGVPNPDPDHARQGGALGSRHARRACRLGAGRPARTRAEHRHQLGSGRRRGDRHEAVPLRPLGRRREHSEPDGVTRHARRDPDHAGDVRAVEGRVPVQASGNDRVKGKGEMETWYLVGPRSDAERTEQAAPVRYSS